MSEEVAGSRWLRRTSITGGWAVFCRLCGKSSKRTFMASMTNYGEAERASRAFAHEHIASGEHQAALRAYQSEDAAFITAGEKLLAEIFGTKALGEGEIRRQSARRAARKVAAQAKKERARAQQEAQPRCAICGLAVSLREDREGDRLTLPSGALVHTKCTS